MPLCKVKPVGLKREGAQQTCKEPNKHADAIYVDALLVENQAWRLCPTCLIPMSTHVCIIVSYNCAASQQHDLVRTTPQHSFQLLLDSDNSVLMINGLLQEVCSPS